MKKFILTLMLLLSITSVCFAEIIRNYNFTNWFIESESPWVRSNGVTEYVLNGHTYMCDFDDEVNIVQSLINYRGHEHQGMGDLDIIEIGDSNYSSKSIGQIDTDSAECAYYEKYLGNKRYNVFIGRTKSNWVFCIIFERMFDNFYNVTCLTLS